MAATPISRLSRRNGYVVPWSLRRTSPSSRHFSLAELCFCYVKPGHGRSSCIAQRSDLASIRRRCTRHVPNAMRSNAPANGTVPPIIWMPTCCVALWVRCWGH